MGYYKYVQKLWTKPKENLGELWRQRLIAWRQDPSTIRLEHPTRIDRARSLGYRAKQGMFVVRQRVIRGGHVNPSLHGAGRRSKKQSTRMALVQNYQWIAEGRANKQYQNCEVLNSYYVAHDGLYYWYEVILVDRNHPAMKADPTLSWITKSNNTGRVYRGLTSAGKKSRGLRSKGAAARKFRPSKSAVWRRRNKGHTYKW